MKEDTIIPYELPEVENHSFFFIDQHIDPFIEAKLHQHDAWELCKVSPAILVPCPCTT